jgi:ribonuclease Z
MSSRPAEFTHDALRVLGHSLAGEETYFILPELNLAFDIGRAPRELIGIDHVFLSHGHMDHAAGLAYYCAQRSFLDNAPGALYLHEALLEPVRRLLAIWSEIDGGRLPAELHAAQPGVDVALRRDLVVRPFEVNHPFRGRGRAVAGLGFAAIEVRKKLRDEYQDLTGPQLVDLKRRGVEIDRRVELPLVAYCGDTAPGDFLDLPHVAGAKVLLLECTFLDPEHQERARAGNHIHVRDLRAILPRLRNERIVLTHTSRRTAMSDARRLLEREIDARELERVSFLAEHRRRRRPRPGP